MNVTNKLSNSMLMIRVIRGVFDKLDLFNYDLFCSLKSGLFKRPDYDNAANEYSRAGM